MSDLPSGHVISGFRERNALLVSEHVFSPEQFYQDVVEVVGSFWDIDNLAPALPKARGALAGLEVQRGPP